MYIISPLYIIFYPPFLCITLLKRLIIRARSRKLRNFLKMHKLWALLYVIDIKYFYKITFNQKSDSKAHVIVILQKTLGSGPV